MKNVSTSIAMLALCATVTAQTGSTDTTGTNSTEDRNSTDQNCLVQADDKTWSNLGLTQDQINRVKDIQHRYKTDNYHQGVRGTEETMRGTQEDRAIPTTGTTGMDRGTGTNSDRTTGTTGTGTDHTTGTTGTTGTTEIDRTTGNTTGATGTGTNKTGDSSGQLGYDDNTQEAMERELRTVLTTAQFDLYQEWCQDHDNTRGDRETDMDR